MNLEKELRKTKFSTKEQYVLGFVMRHQDGAENLTTWSGESIDEVVERHKYIREIMISIPHSQYMISTKRLLCMKRRERSIKTRLPR